MDILKYIPQRPPMLMVDEMTEADATTAVTTFQVRADNPFVEDDGTLAECAVIENLAQSASALAGKRALDAGATKAPTGYIGEVKKFSCQKRPRVGQTLTTTVKWGLQLGDITIVNVFSQADGEPIATTQMKVYMSKD